MKKHPDNTALLKDVCTTLVNLAPNTTCNAAIKAAGGIAVVNAVKKNHPDNFDIQNLVDALMAVIL